MGLLVDGKWQDRWYDTDETGGEFKRQEQHFRHWITADGAAGPSGDSGFNASADRYHLYVSLACPWAHRVLIMRALKGLEDFFPISVVHWRMAGQGWTFEHGNGVIPDPVHQVDYLYQLYQRADSRFSGRVTVPVIWDRKRGTIVNNESSEIIRMLGTAFDDLGANRGDYYPDHLREEIDRVNERVYHRVNNGVYKAGFATTQDAYQKAVGPLFESLDWLENRLRDQAWLAGDQFTEADIRLFTTLIRFDPVYVGHFKCNLRRIADYPNLWAYTRAIYQHPRVRPTVNFQHIKQHYYVSHETINPTAVVPDGPIMDLDAPHDRGDLALPAVLT